MPIYEYECRACGHQFEVLILPRSEAPVCSSCQSGDLQRLISLFAVESDGTRQSNLHAERKRRAPAARDKAIAEREEIEHHHH